MGRAQAECFAREGTSVIVTDVDAPSLELAVQEMRAQGLDVSGRELDVSDREACFALAGELVPVDILVNNAGVTECAEVLDLS